MIVYFSLFVRSNQSHHLMLISCCKNMFIVFDHNEMTLVVWGSFSSSSSHIVSTLKRLFTLCSSCLSSYTIHNCIVQDWNQAKGKLPPPKKADDKRSPPRGWGRMSTPTPRRPSRGVFSPWERLQFKLRHSVFGFWENACSVPWVITSRKQSCNSKA